jgi:hypothetical protein
MIEEKAEKWAKTAPTLAGSEKKSEPGLARLDES